MESIDIHNFKLYLLAVEKIICFAVVFIASKKFSLFERSLGFFNTKGA